MPHFFVGVERPTEEKRSTVLADWFDLLRTLASPLDAICSNQQLDGTHPKRPGRMPPASSDATIDSMPAASSELLR
jgi:hypothetical protein